MRKGNRKIHVRQHSKRREEKQKSKELKRTGKSPIEKRGVVKYAQLERQLIYSSLKYIIPCQLSDKYEMAGTKTKK